MSCAKYLGMCKQELRIELFFALMLRTKMLCSDGREHTEEWEKSIAQGYISFPWRCGGSFVSYVLRDTSARYWQ